MKYRAIKISGTSDVEEWAVAAYMRKGVQYHYVETVCDTEDEAKEQAMLMSLRWHYDEARHNYEALCKAYPSRYGDHGSNYSGDLSDFGDLLA